MCFVSSLKDQVEHAHDNPLVEITLGEKDMIPSEELEEHPPENLGHPKTLNWEVDVESQEKSEGVKLDPVDTRTKEEDTTKENNKRKVFLCLQNLKIVPLFSVYSHKAIKHLTQLFLTNLFLFSRSRRGRGK